MSNYKLQDQVDEPIKEVVTILNLIGLTTVWSCCGYNYKEKEGIIPRKHFLGIIQFHVKITDESLSVIKSIVSDVCFMQRWRIVFGLVAPEDSVIQIQFWLPNRPGDCVHDPASPHFHEMPNGAILGLMKKLAEFKHLMKDSVTLVDHNKIAKEKMPNWEMPISEDWAITKQDGIKAFEKWGL